MKKKQMHIGGQGKEMKSEKSEKEEAIVPVH